MPSPTNAVPPWKWSARIKLGRLERESQMHSLLGRPSEITKQAVRQDLQVFSPSQYNSRFVQFMASFPLIKQLIIIAGIVTGSFIFLKLVSRSPSPQLSGLTKIAFSRVVFVFAFKYYSDYLVDNFFTIKTKILNIHQGHCSGNSRNGGNTTGSFRVGCC